MKNRNKKQLKKMINNLNKSNFSLPKEDCVPEIKVKNIYQLRIDLNGFKPPVWRRILVEDQTTFAQLHQMILVLFGWTAVNQYSFTVGEKELVGNSPFRWQQLATEETLATCIQENKTFKYVCRPKEAWKFTIKVESITDVSEYSADETFPHCLTVTKDSVTQSSSMEEPVRVKQTMSEINAELKK